MQWIKNKVENRTYTVEDGRYYWREKVFLHLLLFVLIAGAVVVPIGIAMSFKVKLYSIAILDTFAYLFFLLMFFMTRIHVRIRLYSLLALLLVVAIVLILFIGPYGAGTLYLTGFPIFVALLLGYREAYVALAIQILVIVLIYLGLEFKWFGNLGVNLYDAQGWVASAVNMVVVAGIGALPSAFIVRRLDLLSREQKNMTATLKEQNKDLKLAKDRAEHADDLKNKFLSNLSHEIRTPLNSVVGFSDMILQQMEREGDPRAEYIQYIQKSGLDLLETFSNIMDIAKLESGNLNIMFGKIYFPHFWDRIQESYKLKKLKTPDINVCFHPHALDLSFHSDLCLLERVVEHLIDNGIKYSNGYPVEVEVKQHACEIIIAVRDQGPGIGAEIAENIFSPFGKYDITRDLKSGVGLGLAIAKGIMETLGGRIWFESEKGKGASFYAAIPV